ncbi:hypothetical protein [Zobellia sp. 1_MG-2023]|uniref:hypothetical protein n=1 Tax=Zobellia sp. 1_MG-2023 TaxID=3062626 RepID=UPI0026E13D62|nr:hypothetical protein [Zobellia sp. 1_MG-2023]MDO6819208.1 hypothetical protein [Zobellia sp. 1_MG-2023]
MLLKKVNIEEKLSKIRPETDHKNLSELYQILNRDIESREKIGNTLQNKNSSATNALNLDLLETNRIYHVNQIKKICVDYRLRFLTSNYFKGEIPAEAIAEIKRIEEAHNIELKGFRILAPSKLFKLEDKDDPVLFAPIGNNYFYLIHKWGNDLHPLRKWLMWPFKNIVNLILLIVFLSFFMALLVPEGLFSKNSSNAQFFIIFFFIFKCSASVAIFYGFALGKNFNHAIWNSKFYNA